MNYTLSVSMLDLQHWHLMLMMMLMMMLMILKRENNRVITKIDNSTIKMNNNNIRIPLVFVPKNKQRGLSEWKYIK